MSVNEEYQSTNEELLTSKEELQSLNEELTALNSQLQETLERQRTTSNDLQNILYSTDVATLFLDTELNIRFFTPATKALFSVIPSDIGRPLADLSSLAADSALLADARAVLQTLSPVEREIEAQSGAWYIRRILPYRTQDNGVEGVVITFVDITERRHTADALETAEREAQLANVAKSRFLAAASHDLRQPLQALSLMRGALDRRIREDRKEEALELVARLDETAAAMSGMLNTLLDINQIEAGTVHAEMVSFPIADLLDRLKDEFTYHAQAQNLVLRVVRCGLSIYSDPRLLEQMIRNLLSNALKYTTRGKVLLGCRRRKDVLSIEIWDTGVGIPNEELQTIFDEYHQLDNAARERSRGLGLGLSIVQRLADLLGHRVRVRSQPGKGSVFAIDIMLPLSSAAVQVKDRQPEIDETIAEAVQRTGAVLIIEDDPEVCNLLDLLLKDQGCHTATAPDGIAALDLVARGKIRPDLILADYNLPKGLDGLQVVEKLRAQLHRRIPVIVLTGDISTSTLRDIARHDCVQLNKPVRLKELTQAVQCLLPASRAAGHFPPVRLPTEDVQQSRAGHLCYRRRQSYTRRTPQGARGRRTHRRGFCDVRGLPRSLSSRPRGLSAGRCIPAWNERPRIVAASKPFEPSVARHHDHGQWRRADGGTSHESGRFGFHREAVQSQRPARQCRTRSRAISRFGQVACLAGGGGEPHCGSHAATTADHGPGPRRPPQQEYRRRSRHQPAHGRDPPRLDHEENRRQISSRASAVSACRCRESCGRAACPSELPITVARRTART